MMTPLFSRALIFASTCHAETGRLRHWTDEPEIVHPIDVAMILKRAGLTDEVTLAAAVLHDVVTYTSADLSNIERLFGWEVAALVQSVTSLKGETETERLIRLASADWKAQAIKCADIISNCRDVATLSPAYAATYIPRKARQVAVLSRAPANLRRDADLATRLDRLVMH